MITLNVNSPTRLAQFAAANPLQRQRPASGIVFEAPAFKAASKDMLHSIQKTASGRPVKFGKQATYVPQVEVGIYGLPKTHIYYDCFKADKPVGKRPGVLKIVGIKSLDPSDSNPATAYASEITLDLRGTLLEGKTVPGEHLSFLDISDSKKFSAEFKKAISAKGDAYRFSEDELKKLGEARLKTFTISSPIGGERDAQDKLTGTVRLIVRRVENPHQDTFLGYAKKLLKWAITGNNTIKGPMTNYLVNLKPGDALVFASPIAHHFLGPQAETPAIFLGIGSSVSPYSSMLRTRFEIDKGPYADTYMAIGHTKPALEYHGNRFRTFAENQDNHFTYRPVFSREPDKSKGIKHLQGLFQQKEEARKLFSMLKNPKTHIYISGFFEFDKQLIAALKKSAARNADLGMTPKEIDRIIEQATQEGRFHVEGEVREDLVEGLQGY